MKNFFLRKNFSGADFIVMYLITRAAQDHSVFYFFLLIPWLVIAAVLDSYFMTRG